jgi:hypothetical protein
MAISGQRQIAGSGLILVSADTMRWTALLHDIALTREHRDDGRDNLAEVLMFRSNVRLATSKV